MRFGTGPGHGGPGETAESGSHSALVGGRWRFSQAREFVIQTRLVSDAAR